MFSAQRPSTDAIERFLRDSQKLPLSYGPIGIVKEQSVVRQLDDELSVIGHGSAGGRGQRAQEGQSGMSEPHRETKDWKRETGGA